MDEDPRALTNDEQNLSPSSLQEAGTADQPKIENTIMEVHHHPDLHHRKKKWKEYLLEFVMIFLAVTLGFFAESLREHISDDARARVYGASLSEDFKADTASLHQLITYSELKIKYIDSLEYCINTIRNARNDSILYNRVLYLISTFQFDNINGTYQQLLHSGSLRFFNQQLVNSLNSYDAISLKLKLMEDWENKFLYEKVNPQTQEMFNYKVFDDLRNGMPVTHEMYFKKSDKTSVDILLNQAALIKRLRERQLLQHKSLLEKSSYDFGRSEINQRLISQKNIHSLQDW